MEDGGDWRKRNCFEKLIVVEKIEIIGKEFNALLELDIRFDGLIDFIDETRFKPIVINMSAAANSEFGEAFLGEKGEKLGLGEVNVNDLGNNIVVWVAKLPAIERGDEGGVGSINEIKTFRKRFGHSFKGWTTHDEGADFTS